MEIYQIKIIALNTKSEMPLSVEVDEGELTENIAIKASINGQEIYSSKNDYLPSYQEFRDKLLAIGFGIKCNGSRINAVQSGMMGTNDKMYLVEIGKPTLAKDIVHIWDYADIDTFPDTDQQLSFLDEWSKQLNLRR